MRTLKIFREAARMLSGGALLAGLLVMGGCSDDEGFSPDDGDRVAVSFTAGIDGVAVPGVKSGTRSAGFGGSAGLNGAARTITGLTDAGAPYTDYVAEDGFPTRVFYPGVKSEKLKVKNEGAMTRTTAGGDEWEQNDGVGIFMFTGAFKSSIAAGADNIKYEATPDDGNAAIAEFGAANPAETIYYPQSGTVNFIGYYPYGTSAVGSTTAGEVNRTNYTYNISVADQSTAAKQAAADVLYAKTTGVAKSKTVPVALTFNHVLSKVTLNVTLGDGLTSLTGSDITVAKFGGMPQTATMALQDGAVTAGAAGDISSLKATTPTGTFNATFSAILVPHTGGTNRTIVFTVGGTDYTGTIPDEDAFATGNHYTYPVTVKKSGVTMGTVSIDRWNEKPGPDGNVDTPPVGMVLIPKGTFWMGSPNSEPNRFSSNETQHEVTLTKDFYMSKYPITNAQYAAFLNVNSISYSSGTGSGSVSYNDETGTLQTNVTKTFIYEHTSYGLTYSGTAWVPASGYENYPVIKVTWYGAKAYADWVSQTTGVDCRLPTEAQWEYACRGNYPNKATERNTLPFGIGDGRKLVLGMANYYIQYSYDLDSVPPGDYNVGNNTGYLGETSAVGSYSPNNYGLYDMHGNVFEWCLDQCALPPADYGSGSAINPVGTSGRNRVLRGGSWNSFARNCRSAYRNLNVPVNANGNYGFRVAVVVP